MGRAIRRQAILKDYANEIQTLYDSIAGQTQIHVAIPTNWNMQSAVEFVHATISSVLKNSLQVDDDIFQFGCDRFVTSVYSVIIVSF
jgi:hypothetical protein